MNTPMTSALTTPSQPQITTAPPATAKSSELLKGGSSLQIEHQGAIYLLRTTAKGGLILTK
jgi:hemin uptake protein HemP